MRAAKRFWIYSGLGIPEGVALVGRPARSTAERRVLLIGAPAVQGIVPPLSLLVAGHGGAMHVDVRRATLRQWAENDWLTSHISVFRPTSVFVGIDPRDSLARQLISGRIRRGGAQDVWLVPPQVPWVATRRHLPAPESSVEGYALWAARAFAVIK
jgi:hypothetical protein